jgi:hypothetical protein
MVMMSKKFRSTAIAGQGEVSGDLSEKNPLKRWIGLQDCSIAILNGQFSARSKWKCIHKSWIEVHQKQLE